MLYVMRGSEPYLRDLLVCVCVLWGREEEAVEGCLEEYIGETGDTSPHRITVYKQQIRDAFTGMLYVSWQIDNCVMNQRIKFKTLPLHKFQNDNTVIRKIKENYFINLTKPKLNAS